MKEKPEDIQQSNSTNLVYLNTCYGSNTYSLAETSPKGCTLVSKEGLDKYL